MLELNENQIGYQTITGFVIVVDNSDDIDFLREICAVFNRRPLWKSFGSYWMKLGKETIWKDILAEEIVKISMWKICQDLESRLGIAQGEIPPPDYLDILADAIKMKYSSRYEFCKQNGIDQGQLSRVLCGKADFSLATLKRILESLGLVLTIVEKKDFELPPMFVY